MTIIYRTSLELTLEKEVVELRGMVARSIQAINAYEREVAELKNKALMDYATLAGNTVLIRELKEKLEECEKGLEIAIPATSWFRAEEDKSSW